MLSKLSLRIISNSNFSNSENADWSLSEQQPMIPSKRLLISSQMAASNALKKSFNRSLQTAASHASKRRLIFSKQQPLIPSKRLLISSQTAASNPLKKILPSSPLFAERKPLSPPSVLTFLYYYFFFFSCRASWILSLDTTSILPYSCWIFLLKRSPHFEIQLKHMHAWIPSMRYP